MGDPREVSPPAKRIEERPELPIRLLDFSGGVAPVHDPGAGEEPGAFTVELGAAERESERAISVSIDPPDGPCIGTAVERLEVSKHRERGLRGRAAYGGRWVQRRDHREHA
ncbi:MAG: hypothetical protein QOI81_1642, partial [Actinomycetota bacterium]|nr:hypothetical protein [Actinomycetota bacterium]